MKFCWRWDVSLAKVSILVLIRIVIPDPGKFLHRISTIFFVQLYN